MKKKVLLLAAAAMLSVGASAQLTIGVKAGYAFPSHGLNLGTSVDGNETTTLYGTNGKGIPVSAEVAYFFNDNIGIQLDASFLIGTEMTHDEVLTAGLEERTYTKTNQLRLSPQLVLKTDLGIYGRLGMVLPVMGKTTQFYENVNSAAGAGIATAVEVEAKGKFSIGFIAAAGYQFNLNDKLSIFGELEYISLGIKRASTEITKYEIGGTSVLDTPGGPSSDVQDYEDTTTPGDNMAQGSKSAYHSIGLNIGVRFTLGGK